MRVHKYNRLLPKGIKIISDFKPLEGDGDYAFAIFAVQKRDGQKNKQKTSNFCPPQRRAKFERNGGRPPCYIFKFQNFNCQYASEGQWAFIVPNMMAIDRIVGKIWRVFIFQNFCRPPS